MAFLSRRRFLTHVTCVTGVMTVVRLEAAQSTLDKFVIPAAPCTEADLTPAVPDAAGFKAGSPRRTSLVEPGAAGAKVILAGFVIGLKCGRVKDARLDFWQADARGAYDMQAFRFRGHQLTDAEGRYRLETIMPGPVGTRAPHLGVRLTPPGQPPLTTALFFPDELRNASDPQVAPKLVMKRDMTFKTQAELRTDIQAFRFDFILNL